MSTIPSLHKSTRQLHLTRQSIRSPSPRPRQTLRIVPKRSTPSQDTPHLPTSRHHPSLHQSCRLVVSARSRLISIKIIIRLRRHRLALAAPGSLLGRSIGRGQRFVRLFAVIRVLRHGLPAQPDRRAAPQVFMAVQAVCRPAEGVAELKLAQDKVSVDQPAMSSVRRVAGVRETRERRTC